MFIPNSDNPLNLDIDDLFKDEEDSQLPDDSSNENLTQNMTNRINKVRQEAESNAKEKLAKELGYESYTELRKAQTNKLALDHGYDPEEIEKVVEPIVQKRLEDDPRFKKLEELEAREKEAYINRSLAAINETTGLQLKPSDLSQETINLWEKGVELEQAYYAVHGKSIITNRSNNLQRGSLDHLAPSGGSSSVKTRKLTEKEKGIWRSIIPDITEEELSKKTTPVGGK